MVGMRYHPSFTAVDALAARRPFVQNFAAAKSVSVDSASKLMATAPIHRAHTTARKLALRVTPCPLRYLTALPAWW